MAPEGEREDPEEEDAEGDDKEEEEEEEDQASSEEDTKKKKGRRGNVEEKVSKGGRPRRATAGRTRGKIKHLQSNELLKVVVQLFKSLFSD